MTDALKFIKARFIDGPFVRKTMVLCYPLPFIVVEHPPISKGLYMEEFSESKAPVSEQSLYELKTELGDVFYYKWGGVRRRNGFFPKDSKHFMGEEEGL